MEWGLRYTTGLSSDSVCEIIQAESRKYGYEITENREENGAITLHATQGLPLWCLLLRRLPPVVDWRVWEEENRTLVYADSKSSPSFLGVIFFFCSLSALSFAQSMAVLSRDWFSLREQDLYAAGCALVFSILLLFLTYALVLSGGMERISRITEVCQRKADRSGTSFSQIGTGISLRHALRTGLFLVFAVTALVYPVRDLLNPVTLFSELPISVRWLISMLLLSVIGLAASLPVMLRQEGFSMRTLAGLAGTGSCVSVLFILMAQFPWSSFDHELTREQAVRVKEMSLFVQAAPAREQSPKNASIHMPVEAVRIRIQSVRFRAWMSVVFSVFLFAVGAGFWVQTFLCAEKGARYLRQIAFHPDLSVNLRATTGNGFLGVFRTIWIYIWLALGGAITCGFSILTCSSWYTLGLGRQPVIGPALNTVDASLFFVEIALGGRFPAALIGSMVRSAWLVYIGFCWLLLFVSVGTLFAAALRDRRRLRIFTAADEHLPTAWSFYATVRSVYPQLPITHLAIVDVPFPYAQAHCRILGKNEAFIEISSWCVTHLTEKELHAVLGHELAHIRLRHPHRDWWLRLLGRITFVGDGFVRTLEDTFGYEITADRLAVQELGVAPQSLGNALKKFRAVLALRHLSSRSFSVTSESGQMSGTAADAVDDDRSQPFLLRFRQSLSMYLRQYLGYAYSGYWHPSVDQRIMALEKLVQKEERAVKTDETDSGRTI